jgi:hypothetical protein
MAAKAFVALLALALVLTVVVTGCSPQEPAQPAVDGENAAPDQVAASSFDSAVVEDDDTVELGEMV